MPNRTPARSQAECSIVNGSDWAFAYATLEKWASLCRAEQQFGAPLALWPKESSFTDSPAVMYIDLSSKNQQSLMEFVCVSQSQFKAKAPHVVFLGQDSPVAASKLKAVHFSASGDPGANHERITYVEGPTAFFILVLSARTHAARAMATVVH